MRKYYCYSTLQLRKLACQRACKYITQSHTDHKQQSQDTNSSLLDSRSQALHHYAFSACIAQLVTPNIIRNDTMFLLGYVNGGWRFHMNVQESPPLLITTWQQGKTLNCVEIWMLALKNLKKPISFGLKTSHTTPWWARPVVRLQISSMRSISLPFSVRIVYEMCFKTGEHGVMASKTLWGIKIEA